MKKETKRIFSQLIEAMEFNRNPLLAAPMAKYMKYKFDYLGINQPLRKALTRDFLKETKALDPEELLSLAKAIWTKPEREYQYVAIDLLHTAKKKWNKDFIAYFLQIVTEKSWWDSVDLIAIRLIGGYYASEPIPGVLKKWVLSENIWQNRTALLFQLMYKEAANTDFLQSSIAQLKPKKEFFIQKAIGWALRQHYRIDPAWVESIVETENLSGLARREALKHG